MWKEGRERERETKREEVEPNLELEARNSMQFLQAGCCNQNI